MANKSTYKFKKRPEKLLQAQDILRKSNDPKIMVKFYIDEF